ncbi:MAG: hypothetical protein KDA60_09480, partial [Planctomycetales bacterium]|nr:hypothetical protein [Planctomycetales bacterium]
MTGLPSFHNRSIRSRSSTLRCAEPLEPRVLLASDFWTGMLDFNVSVAPLADGSAICESYEPPPTATSPAIAPLGQAEFSFSMELDPFEPELATDRLPVGAIGSSGQVSWDVLGFADRTYVLTYGVAQADGVKIYFQRFNELGESLTGPQLVHQLLASGPADQQPGERTTVLIAPLPNNEYVIVWNSSNQINLRRYNAADQPLAAVFLVPSPTGATSEFDVAATSAAGFRLAWVDGTETSILGQEFDAAGNPVDTTYTWITAQPSNQLGLPQFVDQPGDGVALQWLEYPDTVTRPTPSDDPDDAGGRGHGAEVYEFLLQTFDSFGVSTSPTVTVHTSDRDLSPASVILPSGYRVTVRNVAYSLEFAVIIETFDELGTLVNSEDATLSRFPNTLAPQIALLDDGSLVIAYGEPQAEGPLIRTRRYDSHVQPLGPSNQINVEDDVTYPPAVRLASLADQGHVIAWPHFELDLVEPILSTRLFRGVGTNITLEIPTDFFAGVDINDVSLEITGLPADVTLNYGTESDGIWAIPFAFAGMLRIVSDAPLPVVSLTVDLVDTSASTLLATEHFAYGTVADDILPNTPDNQLVFGDAGTDRFPLPGNVDEYSVSRTGDSVRVTHNATGEWDHLIDVEQLWFADILLDVDELLDTSSQRNDYYDVGEDGMLVVSAPTGVLANDNILSEVHAFLSAEPISGELTLLSDGSLVYIPAADFHGTVSFKYDTYSMVLVSPLPPEDESQTFVGSITAGTPSLDFSALPTPLSIGADYTVTFELTELIDEGGTFQFALADGTTLIADELASGDLATVAGNTLTFHFQHQASFSGLQFVATPNGSGNGGTIRVRDFRIVDDATGAILFNSSVADNKPRTVTIDILPVPEPPHVEVLVTAQTFADPIALEVQVTTNDPDNESLETHLSGFLPGGTLSDGTHSVVTSGPDHVIDVSG